MKWTNEQLKNLSPAAKLRNPDIFGVVGAIQDSIPKPDQIPALDQGKKACERSPRGLGFCVQIISMRSRLLDFVNLAGGSKGIQDAIAISLGIDDADIRVRWEFHQIKTTGREGTIVNIQQL